MHEIVVREAIPEDAEAIAAIHIGTWQYAYHGLLPDDFLAALSVPNRTVWWTRNLTDPMPRTAVFVGELGGVIAGFCSVGPSSDDEAKPTAGELYTIYVKSDWMGRGIGSALMNAACHRLHKLGFTEATLWVLEGNAQGRAFYERRGWNSDGRTKVEKWGKVELHEVRYGTLIGHSDTRQN